MSVLLFKLNGVSIEEADDVRQILEQHKIDYYETDAGRWGISVAAIWLREKDQLHQAKLLLDEYQQQRQEQANIFRQENKASEEHASLWKRIQQAPLHYLLIFTAILAVFYISIIPFITV